MSQHYYSGQVVQLEHPERGYFVAVLVEKIGLKWLLRLSSGYEFTLYEDQFSLSD